VRTLIGARFVVKGQWRHQGSIEKVGYFLPIHVEPAKAILGPPPRWRVAPGQTTSERGALSFDEMADGDDAAELSLE
jgi:hypothetical protein